MDKKYEEMTAKDLRASIAHLKEFIQKRKKKGEITTKSEAKLKDLIRFEKRKQSEIELSKMDSRIDELGLRCYFDNRGKYCNWEDELPTLKKFHTGYGNPEEKPKHIEDVNALKAIKNLQRHRNKLIREAKGGNEDAKKS
jgi:hypothetical protein